MTNPVKLSQEYQDQWKDNNLNNKFIVVNNISYKVQLHKEMENTLCSAAACLNVLGNLDSNIDDLKNYLNSFELNIEEICEFPYHPEMKELIYDDRGSVVFEWIGQKKSPINESSGGRGFHRTSVDASVLAKIENKSTQIFID